MTLHPTSPDDFARRHHVAFLVALVILTGLLTTSASARIRVQTARLAAGEVVVSGTVRPPTDDVTLAIGQDRAIKVTTDRRGRFTWRGTEFPPTCTVEIRAGSEKKTSVISDCGPQGPPGPPGANGRDGQSGISAIYVVKKVCWLGPQTPGQVPPTPPPVCEIKCNPEDFFLSATCGEGDILGPADHPNGFKCRAFVASIVCAHR